MADFAVSIVVLILHVSVKLFIVTNVSSIREVIGLHSYFSRVYDMNLGRIPTFLVHLAFKVVHAHLIYPSEREAIGVVRPLLLMSTR